MQRLFLVLHRYIALAGAAFLIIVALSGSLLVFEGAIDRALNPRLWSAPGSGALLSLDTLAARAAGAVSGQSITMVSPPTVPGRAVALTTNRGVQVFLDPATGAVLGTRGASEGSGGFGRWLHRVHETMLLGKVGGVIVDAATVGSFVLVLTGIVLWWPDKILTIARGASWKRVVFDLHHVTGILSSLVLLFVTATGVVMAYSALGGMIRRLDRAPAPRPVAQPAAAPGAASIGLDSAAHLARGALPGAQLMFLSAPSDARAPLVAAMRFPEDHTPGGRSRVIVDRYRGVVLQTISARQSGMGTRTMNLMRPLHTGDIFGPVSWVLWSLAALFMAIQAVTGVLMWWNARGARSAAAARAVSAPGRSSGV